MPGIARRTCALGIAYVGNGAATISTRHGKSPTRPEVFRSTRIICAMKYLMFSTGTLPTPRLGVLHADRIVEVEGQPSLLALIQAGRDVWARTAATVRGQLAKGTVD